MRPPKSKFDKNLVRLAFSMACPVFLILNQNVSLLFFFLLLINRPEKNGLFRIRHFTQLFAIGFALTSIFTTFYYFNDKVAFNASMGVLINYIYWPIMVVTIVSLGPYLNENEIAKGICMGLILFIAIYFLFPVKIPLFVNKHSPNSFSLVLICYTAPAVVYIKQKYGTAIGLAAALIIILFLILEGRRAGTSLTAVSAILALFLPKINLNKIVFGGLMVSLIGLFIFSDFGEQTLTDLNPRISELIYETNTVQTEDRSVLTRQLMVEKGLIIYKQNPLTGVGLNNFMNTEVEFEGNFEGSEFVIDKSENNNLSAHNSYITLLAEGGIMPLVCLMSIQVFILISFIINYNNRTQLENAIIWGLLAVSIHLYFITGIVNVYVWFLIAISLSISVRKKKKYAGAETRLAPFLNPQNNQSAIQTFPA